MKRASAMTLTTIVATLAVTLTYQACGQLKGFQVVESDGAQSLASSDLKSSASDILNKNCASCHDSKNTSGTGLDYITDLNKLAVSSYVVKSDPNSSKLYQVIIKGQMPLSAPLSSDDAGVISDWIKSLGTAPILVPTPTPTPTPTSTPSPALLPMPESEVNYPGSSATKPFVAMEPYVVNNIQGASKTIQLWGYPRQNDFSGNVPFVNPGTGHTDPATIQAWSSVTGSSVSVGLEMTNAGLLGRVDKETFNGAPVTMVRYNKGDGITEGKCRTQLNSWVIPTRTHTRWELEVAFGKADGVNDWTLTPTGASPVLVWQLNGETQGNPALSIIVDTDVKDPTKLMISFFQRVGTAPYPILIGRVNGISRNTMVPMVVDAFMDERETSNGGKGLLRFWVNNGLVLEKLGPTRDMGAGENSWSLDTYLFVEESPYPYTRATFWKTARMLVFPMGKASVSP